MIMFHATRRYISSIGVIILLILASAAGLQGVSSQDATPIDHSDAEEHVKESTPEESSAHSPDAKAYNPDVAIRSMTAEEIEQIRQGRGASLALPAELNGVPGPRHVLDLADELALTDDQRVNIEVIFRQFQSAVIPAGDHYLAAVQTLEEAFRSQKVTAGNLPELVEEVSRLEGELVAIHLLAHLSTAQALNAEQIATYNRLRGYQE